MSFGSALVDRGRVVRQRKSQTKIEGTTARVPQKSEWFRMRLAPPMQEETSDEGSTRHSSKAPLTLINKRDFKGNPVVINGKDKLEVKSKELPDGIYEIVGTPVVLRKRRSIIGYEAQLVQVQ